MTDADNGSSDENTPPSDSGAPASDSGAPASDSGAPPSDSGAPPSDSGAPPSDSGAPPSDSGASPSDGSSDDGGSAPAAAAPTVPTVDAVVKIDPDDGTPQASNSYQVAEDAALTLSWTATNAASVNISGVGDGQNESGSVSIPASAATYTLVAIAADGTQSVPVTIDVETHPAGTVVSGHSDIGSGVAAVISFTATKEGLTVTHGAVGDALELVVLCSDSTDACTINGADCALAETDDGHKTGSVTVTLDATMSGDFGCTVSADGTSGDPGSLHLDIGPASEDETPDITLTCVNSEGESVEQEELEGGAPLVVKEAKQATISWNISGAPTTVSITNQTDPGATGSITLTFSDDNEGKSESYTFEASNAAGSAKPVTVNVKYEGEGAKVTLLEAGQELEITKGTLYKGDYAVVEYAAALIGELAANLGAEGGEDDAKSWWQEIQNDITLNAVDLWTNLEQADWSWNWSPIVEFKAWGVKPGGEHTVAEFVLGKGEVKVPGSLDGYHPPVPVVEVELSVAPFEVTITSSKASDGATETKIAEPSLAVTGALEVPLVTAEKAAGKAFTLEGEIKLEATISLKVDLEKLGKDAGDEAEGEGGEGDGEGETPKEGGEGETAEPNPAEAGDGAGEAADGAEEAADVAEDAGDSLLEDAAVDTLGAIAELALPFVVAATIFYAFWKESKDMQAMRDLISGATVDKGVDAFKQGFVAALNQQQPPAPDGLVKEGFDNGTKVFDDAFTKFKQNASAQKWLAQEQKSDPDNANNPTWIDEKYLSSFTPKIAAQADALGTKAGEQVRPAVKEQLMLSWADTHNNDLTDCLPVLVNLWPRGDGDSWGANVLPASVADRAVKYGWATAAQVGRASAAAKAAPAPAPQSDADKKFAADLKTNAEFLDQVRAWVEQNNCAALYHQSHPAIPGGNKLIKDDADTICGDYHDAHGQFPMTHQGDSYDSHVMF